MGDSLFLRDGGLLVPAGEALAVHARCCCPEDEPCPCCGGDAPDSWLVVLSSIGTLSNCSGPEYDLNGEYDIARADACGGVHWRGWYCEDDANPPWVSGYRCRAIRVLCEDLGPAGYRLAVVVTSSQSHPCPSSGTGDTSVQSARFEKTWAEKPACNEIEEVELTRVDGSGAWAAATCIISAVYSDEE